MFIGKKQESSSVFFHQRLRFSDGRGHPYSTTYFRIWKRLLYSSVHNFTDLCGLIGAESRSSSAVNSLGGDLINIQVAPKTSCVSSSSVSTTRKILPIARVSPINTGCRSRYRLEM